MRPSVIVCLWVVWNSPGLRLQRNNATKHNHQNACLTRKNFSLSMAMTWPAVKASMFVLYCRFMAKDTCSDKDFVPILTQYGLCHTFNSGPNKSVLHSLLEGLDFGLNIVLDVQLNQSTLSDFSTGLKVIVHDQNTFVNRHSGFNILPGTQASVAVKLRKVSYWYTNLGVTPL